MLGITFTEFLVLVLVLLVLYGVALGVTRVYFNTLSKFPGPRLAAATLWYEFYYDVVKRGKFAWEIKRMHEIYGKVQLTTQGGFCSLSNICRSGGSHKPI